jgi:glyoxylase-like metal-dependent hydrolase (beta-lactamase superfamily II)
MIFHQLFEPETSTYTYVIADAGTREAVIVDPVLEMVERDIAFLREQKLVARYSLETHIHADHVTGGGRLRVRLGLRTVVPDGAPADCADRFLGHRAVLSAGNVTIRAIHTPGHTPCHNAYLLGDRVLTGDALLIGGCGRTDFQGGDPGTLYDSITKRLFTLPEWTRVFPGHDYNGRTESTIGGEKRGNPRLAGKSRDEFIAIMNALNLPRPKRIDLAVPANRECGMTQG